MMSSSGAMKEDGTPSGLCISNLFCRARAVKSPGSGIRDLTGTPPARGPRTRGIRSFVTSRHRSERRKSDRDKRHNPTSLAFRVAIRFHRGTVFCCQLCVCVFFFPISSVFYCDLKLFVVVQEFSVLFWIQR